MRVTAIRLEDAVVRQRLDRRPSLRRRALLAAICIPVVFTFAACGDDTSPPPTVAPTTGTSTVAASTGDAVGLTADLYDELMRNADAMTASFTDSATAQATCASVAQGVGIADCRRQIKAAIATAEAAARTFKISSFRNMHDLAEETCQVALDDRQFAVHEYLRALRDWAADAALNNPAGSPNGEGTNTLIAVTRIRNSQLPAAKDETRGGVPASARVKRVSRPAASNATRAPALMSPPRLPRVTTARPCIADPRPEPRMNARLRQSG